MFDLADVIDFFELHNNQVSNKELIDRFGVSKNWFSEYLRKGLFTKTDKTFSLSDKFYAKFQEVFPEGVWRRDKLQFKPGNSVNQEAARKFITSKIIAKAEAQHLLIKGLTFGDDFRYQLEFYPGRYKKTESGVHVLFDFAHTPAEKLFEQAKVAAGHGDWELNRYFRNLHAAPPALNAYQGLQEQVVLAMHRHYNEPLMPVRISDKFNSMIERNSITLAAFDLAPDVRFDPSTRTLMLKDSFYTGNYKDKLADLLDGFHIGADKIKIGLRGLTSITFKRILPVALIGLSIDKIANAHHKASAAFDELGSVVMPIGWATLFSTPLAGGSLESPHYLNGFTPIPVPPIETRQSTLISPADATRFKQIHFMLKKLTAHDHDLLRDHVWSMTQAYRISPEDALTFAELNLLMHKNVQPLDKDTSAHRAYHYTERFFRLKPGELDPTNPNHLHAFDNILSYIKTGTTAHMQDPEHALFISNMEHELLHPIESLWEQVKTEVKSKWNDILNIDAKAAWDRTWEAFKKLKPPAIIPKLHAASTNVPFSEPEIRFRPFDFTQYTNPVLDDNANIEMEKLFSEEENRKILEETFKKQQIPEKQAQKLSEKTVGLMSFYIKRYIENDPKLTTSLKETLLQDIKKSHDITDDSTLNTIADIIDKMKNTVDGGKQFVKNYETGRAQFQAFNKLKTDLNTLEYVSGEFQGIQHGFRAIATIAHFAKSHTWTNVAKTGIGLMDVAIQVTKAIAGQLLQKTGTIGIAAAAGNWISVGLSLVSLIFSFIPQGPSEAEITWDFLQKLRTFIGENFEHVDQRFDYVDTMLKQLMDICKSIVDEIKKNAHQLHDSQFSIEYRLEKIENIIKELYLLTDATGKEILFTEFHSTIRQINDIINHKSPTPHKLSELLDKLVGDLIKQMSQSDFHTGRVLFDKTVFRSLFPKHTSLIFSPTTPLDSSFVTHPLRREQAMRINNIFQRTGNLLGFQAAYAEAVLADELMNTNEIDEEIHAIEEARQETVQAITQLGNSPFAQKTTPLTKAERGAQSGHEAKRYQLQNQLTQSDARKGELTQLRLRAQHSEEIYQVKQEEVMQISSRIQEKKQIILQELAILQPKVEQLDKTIKKLIPGWGDKTNPPIFPLPSEAKECILTHQRIEALQTELITIEQQEIEHNFQNAIDTNQMRPFFKVMNVPIWRVATTQLLDVVESKEHASSHVDPKQQNIHDSMTIGENTLRFIDFIQHQGVLFQRLFGAYAQTLLFINRFYQVSYQEHLAEVTLPDKLHQIIETTVKSELIRVDEETFVEKLTKPSTALQSQLDGYCIELDMYKKLLISFCELAGAHQELLKILADLPDKSLIETQLQDIIDFKKPAPFTNHAVYYILNQAQRALTTTMFLSKLPSPAETVVGAPIASVLSRFKSHKNQIRAMQYQTHLNQTYFSKMFTGRSGPIFIDNRTTTMPKDSHYQNLSIEDLSRTALLEANMECTEDGVLLLSVSGAGKSLFTAKKLGCTHKKVSSQGVRKTELEVHECPPGVRIPGVGTKPASKTILPTAYRQTGDNPLTFIDPAGLDDNRDAFIRLFAMIATQVGVKTIKSLKSILFLVPEYHFRDPRFSALDKTVLALIKFFKKPVAHYKDAIKIVITQNKEYTKEDFIDGLRRYHAFTQEQFEEDATQENQIREQFAALFITEEGQNNVFLFDPETVEQNDELIQRIKSSPSISPNDLELIASDDMRKRFVAQIGKTMKKGTEIFTLLKTIPKEIDRLKKDEAFYEGWLHNFRKKMSEFYAPQDTQANDKDTYAEEPTCPNEIYSTTSQQSAADNLLADIQRLIDKKIEEYEEANKILINIKKEQDTLKSDINNMATRTDLVVDHEIKWDEQEAMGNIKETINDRKRVWGFLWHEDHHRPLHSKVHEYHASWTDPYGESYTTAEPTIIGSACKEWGGTPGEYTLDTKNSNPAEGKYAGHYKGPEHCYGKLHIQIKKPFNRQHENIVKAQSWAETFENNKNRIAILEARMQGINNAKLSLEADYAKALVRKGDQALERESVAFQTQVNISITTQADLERTRGEIQAQRTLYNETLQLFHQEKPNYQTIRTLNDIIDLQSESVTEFKMRYLETLTQLHEAEIDENIHRCEEVTAETKTDHLKTEEEMCNIISDENEYQQCFVEQKPSTQSFLIPGADASSMLCFDSLPTWSSKQFGKNNVPTPPTPPLLTDKPTLTQRWFLNREFRLDPKDNAPIFKGSLFASEPTQNGEEPTYDTTKPPLRIIEVRDEPHICVYRNTKPLQTNVVSDTATMQINPYEVETVCEIPAPPTPPTVDDFIYSGMKSGAMRGAANAVGRALCHNNNLERATHIVQGLLHDAAYFYVSFNRHANQVPLEQAAWNAASDTLYMQATSLAGIIAEKAAKVANQNNHPYIAKGLRFFAKAGPFAYGAYQQGVEEVVGHTVAAYVTADLVESTLDNTFNIIRGA